MPRGIPKNGKRAPWGSRTGRVSNNSAPATISSPVIQETDDQIRNRITERFDVLEELTRSAIAGDVRSVIVSGAPGVGKSFNVERVLNEWDPEGDRHVRSTGYVKATGLYKMLYQFSMPGNIIVFDDSDSLFFDDVSLNILKVACDTTSKRTISWRTEYLMTTDEGEDIPRSFEFHGTIIFITNLDFMAMSQKGHKLAPHLEAMMSRAFYVDLTLKTRRDILVHVNNIMDNGMLSSLGLDNVQYNDVRKFVNEHYMIFRELSLRTVIKVAQTRKSNRDNWARFARITTCKEA